MAGLGGRGSAATPSAWHRLSEGLRLDIGAEMHSAGSSAPVSSSVAPASDAATGKSEGEEAARGLSLALTGKQPLGFCSAPEDEGADSESTSLATPVVDRK